jgi:sec-independent protein translocase protein TatA
MNIFGIGPAELCLIGVVALLVFGPKKLPEIGRSLGKTLKSFQEASREFESEFKREVERAEAAPSTTMTATIEPPSQPALSSSETAPAPTVVETTDASAATATSDRPADPA